MERDTGMTEPYESIEKFLATVKIGSENVVDVSRKVLADGKENVVVCLGNRHLQPEPPKAPDRAESPKRSHMFHAIEGFCHYLGHVKTSNTVVFVDVNAGEFYAVIDDQAEKGFEIITMQPQTHPLWAPWQTELCQSMMVKDFAKFLLANRRQLTGERAKELIADFSQVRAATEVTLESGTGKNCVNGLMIHTKIQGAKGSDTFELPDSFVVRAPLFVGLEAQDIEIDITLEAADPAAVSGVVATLTSADATTKKIEAFEMMCEQVKSQIEDIVVAMGSPEYDRWEYIGGR